MPWPEDMMFCGVNRTFPNKKGPNSCLHKNGNKKVFCDSKATDMVKWHFKRLKMTLSKI